MKIDYFIPLKTPLFITIYHIMSQNGNVNYILLLSNGIHNKNAIQSQNLIAQMKWNVW